MISLLLLAGVFVMPMQGLANDNKERLSELQSRRQSLKSKTMELRRKRYEKMRAAQKISQKIYRNQQHLEAERRKLHYQQQHLVSTRHRLVYLDDRLDRTTGEAVRLAQDTGKRLRALYMGERVSMLQMVLEANDIATLLDRVYYKKRLVAQDRELLAELRQKVMELNGLKNQLAQQKEIISSTIQTIQARNIEIQRSIQVDKVLRDKYQNDARFYEQAENELLALSNGITAEIRQLTSRKSFQRVTGSTGSFIWPIAGAIRSGFGYRFHPIHRTRKMHTGLDIAGPNRGAIRAADGGQVIWAGWRGGYGKTVMINHGNSSGQNIVTLYGHMSGFAVSTGMNVSKGQVIGYEGSTGYSTGPHLHFEVRINGAPVNPLGYL